MLPQVWLQGRQLTGRKADDAPVLAGVELEWGSDNDVEHQDPASLAFSVLFKDGVMDNASFHRGAEIELTYNDRTVFAGTIRSAYATVGAQGLTVTANCIEHLADLDSTFLQTEWLFETSSVRWLTLQNAFTDKGWDLLPRARAHPFGEASTFYTSIKLITLLERYLAANGSLTRWDSSQRVDGQLVKRIGTGVRGASTGANTLATEGPVWVVEYTTEVNTGVITWLEAGNVEQNDWNLDPGTAINSVNLSTQITETNNDGELETDLVDSVRNDTASIARNGINAVEVVTSASATEAADKTAIAQTWFRPDTGWVLEEAHIRDSRELTLERMMRLLDTRVRSQNLVIIRGIRSYTPHQGPGNLRASLIGGNYVWDGEQWDMALKLGRNQAFIASNQYSFADLAVSTDPAVSAGTAESIGRQISFSDFKQITKDPQNANA